MVQCKRCNGVYQATTDDGMQYFHACPPLSAPELAAAVAAGKIVLPLGETADVAVTRRIYERSNKRDENLPSTDASSKGAMKSPGAGVQTVAAPGPVVVVAL